MRKVTARSPRRGRRRKRRSMESTIVMINLFGAVALLLFGLAQVKDGVSRAFGARLRTGLATGTRGSVRSFVSGFVATVALQSSTATALMIASFVERDLVAPRMAQIVLLGANVGTAVTAWIVATGIEWLSPLVHPHRHRSLSQRLVQHAAGGGTALIGIGADAAVAASAQPRDRTDARSRRRSPPSSACSTMPGRWRLILSAALAFVSSSSLAVVVLILSLASTGILSAGLMIVLVLGANLGGAIPPVIATLSGPASAQARHARQPHRSRHRLPHRAAARRLCRERCCRTPAALAGQAAGRRAPALQPPACRSSPGRSRRFCRRTDAAPRAGRSATGRRPEIPRRAGACHAGRGACQRHARSARRRRPHRAHADPRRKCLQATTISPRLQEIAALEKQVDRLQQEVKIYLSQARPRRAGRRRTAAAPSSSSTMRSISSISATSSKRAAAEQVAKKIARALQFSDDGYRGTEEPVQSDDRQSARRPDDLRHPRFQARAAADGSEGRGPPPGKAVLRTASGTAARRTHWTACRPVRCISTCCAT